MAHHFETLLRTAAAAPGARLSELTEILAREEREERARREEELRKQRGNKLRNVERRMIRAN
jgi:hypothetical protein